MKRTPVYLIALALGGALTVSAPADAKAPPAVPRAFPNGAENTAADIVLRAWPNRRLSITAPTVAATSYPRSALTSAASPRAAGSHLFLPALGPFLDLQPRPCPGDRCDRDSASEELRVDRRLPAIGALKTWLGLGALQGTGSSWYLIGNETLSLRPQLDFAVRGVTASGKF